MIKNDKKYIKICLLIFYCISFFYLATNNALASLEVQYPTATIANQSTDAVTASSLPSYIKYLFIAGTALGFSIIIFSLIIGGIMYILSSISPEARAEAKDRISGAISGLLILVLSYLIITTINPQLNIFNLNKLPEPKVPEIIIEKLPGVYLYKGTDCSDSNVLPYYSSISSLGDLKKSVKMVDLVKDKISGDSYISILYENPSFWGPCQYINPNNGCQAVAPFASSASIYRYDFNPSADGGVYLFRKSCVSTDLGNTNDIEKLIGQCKKEGYYMLKEGVHELKSLNFEDVPEEEKICEKYDKDFKCSSKKAPSLAGDNISSIIIKGNYLALFFYFGENDDEEGLWTTCQEFPSRYDVNRAGPRQMKWEIIRNSKGLFPNYVAVMPVKIPPEPKPASSLIPIEP